MSVPFDARQFDVSDNLIGIVGAQLSDVSGEGATLTLPVTAQLLQPRGIVHGGVYCAIVETLGSVAGTVWLAGRGDVVGVSNHTNFLRAARVGTTLHAVASPLHRGRTQQLWLVVISGDDGRVLARGEVRLANIASTEALATGSDRAEVRPG